MSDSRWIPPPLEGQGTLGLEQLHRSVGAALGEHDARQGQALAEGAVAPEWSDAAEATVVVLARGGAEFTAEDVRAVVGDPPGHPNAMGALIGRLARAGLIRRVDVRLSSRRERRRGLERVWVGTSRAQEGGAA